MTRVLLLVVLVAGAALAMEEAPQEVVAEPEQEAEGRMSKAGCGEGNGAVGRDRSE